MFSSLLLDFNWREKNPTHILQLAPGFIVGKAGTRKRSPPALCELDPTWELWHGWEGWEKEQGEGLCKGLFHPTAAVTWELGGDAEYWGVQTLGCPNLVGSGRCH